MAKGIPLMGRGPDGKAKIINVDENGNVKVQQSGTIVELATAAGITVEADAVLELELNTEDVRDIRLGFYRSTGSGSASDLQIIELQWRNKNAVFSGRVTSAEIIEQYGGKIWGVGESEAIAGPIPVFGAGVRIRLRNTGSTALTNLRYVITGAR